MNDKKMFKVLCPITMKDGGTYWMRCGNAFVNRDSSINVHLMAMPVAGLAKNDGIMLQLREVTEDERRERAEKRATYPVRAGGSGPSALAPGGYPGGAPGYGANEGAPSMTNDQIPF